MDLIEPWAREGHLPAISGLMQRGYSARLISTPNMHSASAWTSILTGLNPGRHGLFVFSDRNFATGRQEFFTGGDRTGDTISSMLAAQGLTAGFLNVPMTYPAEGRSGSFMVSGLDAPELNEKAFYPRELRGRLLGRIPQYRFSPPGLGDAMRQGKIETATQAWLDLTSVQTSAAEHLIESHPVDFLMVVYTASDWAGHNLWNRREELRSIYRALDAAVARLIALTGAETQVYLVSDHGMGAHSGASYHLADWLEQHGFMTRTSRRAGGRSAIARGKSVARAVLPPGVREKIKTTLGAERVKRAQAVEKDSFYESVDWGRTIAYTEPGRHVININLAGRNNRGLVAPADYDSTCEQIIDKLAAWKDAHGKPIVERVAKRDDAYSGPFSSRASDLYVYWNSEADAGPPPEEVRARGFWWSGDHRPEGILVAAGPDIRAARGESRPSVCDLVPTILHAAGLAVPSGLDGSVIEEALAAPGATNVVLPAETGSLVSESTSPALSSDEEKLIEDKLRGLGYL
jgi:predicted AlkP superfamily phosphohydrolase/phosphomutase